MKLPATNVKYSRVSPRVVRASAPALVRESRPCFHVPVHVAPSAVEGTENWSLAGVSAVRVALTELNVLEKP